MSDPVSALHGASFTGFSTIREIGPQGMITLRAAPDTPGLEAAIRHCTQTEIPKQCQVVHNAGRAAGWMSPDEYLLILPYDQTDAALAGIAQHMSGAHHLAVSVSDARAVFRVEGAQADQVLAKLVPVDLANFPEGELRRTRAAQVAVAFWRDGDGMTLVCFRSVARYVFDLLASSAKPGSELTSFAADAGPGRVRGGESSQYR